MVVRLSLKNDTEQVVVDDFAYRFLTTDPKLKELGVAHNLRKHSSGCAVFQKAWRLEKGKYRTETIYLHKLIATRFLGKPDTADKRYIMIKNGNKLDCRIDNLAWSTRSDIQRNVKGTSSKTGYRGVFKDRNQYCARIYVDGKPIPIGRFKTPEEAAKAYNEKSLELFGKTRNLNTLKPGNDQGEA